MEGSCEFADPSNTFESYEYEYHYDHYDYHSDDEGKEECFQSCLEKEETTENPSKLKIQKPINNMEIPTYANSVRKNLEPQMQSNGHFLGLQPVHQSYSGQVQQVQQPYPQAILEIHI